MQCLGRGPCRPSLGTLVHPPHDRRYSSYQNSHQYRQPRNTLKALWQCFTCCYLTLTKPPCILAGAKVSRARSPQPCKQPAALSQISHREAGSGTRCKHQCRPR